MLTKINVTGIMKDHVKTIYENGITGEKKELFFFFGVPLLAAGIAFVSPLSDGLTGLIATIMSIFSGLLLNVQVLVCDIKIKLTRDSRLEQQTDKERHEREDQLLLAKELHVNISFCLVISTISLIFLFAWYVIHSVVISHSWPPITTTLMSSLLYYLIVLFFLSLLMVTKRSYSLVVAGIMENNS